MRVISGTAKSRRLLTLSGEDVRPTADRVKEAMFSAVQFEVEGRKVLDLFAGCGQLGLEALSRGAELAVFVDANRKAIEVVSANLQTTGLADHATLFNRDFLSFLATDRHLFDLVFLDPPYREGLLLKALEAVQTRLAPHGKVICEYDSGLEPPQQVGNLHKDRAYRYGKTGVCIFRF